jgi:phospholipid transport system substrate-binding protein
MVSAVRRAVLALAVLMVAVPAQAGGPTERLKQYAAAAQQSPASVSGPSKASSIFAVDEMAERVLGRHWRDRTAAERAEFTPLFGELLAGVYLSQIGRYTGDRLRYTDEVIDGNRATVHLDVRAKPGEALPITMTMGMRGDEWLIHDIIVAGTSILDAYRVQFDHVIRTSSFAELVKRLKDRRRSEN